MINLDDWQKEVLETEGNMLLCSGRQVGKSTIVSIKAGEFAAKNPNTSILVVSATERQAEELFIKILNYISDKYLILVKRGKERPTKHIIKLKNGSIIRCLPTGEMGTGIRGFTIHGLIVDECAWMHEAVFQAITPMLLTTGGWQWLLSTPHGKSGYFYERYKNEDKTFKVFHVKSEEVILNRKISANWTEAQKQGALEHLEREKKSMTKNQYLQEYCGMFVEELCQFFSDDLIKACQTLKRGDFRAGRRYYLGVDIARMGEDLSVFSVVEKTDGGNLNQIESIETSKTRLNETADKIIELDNKYKFKSIYIDTGGIGIAVYDWLLADARIGRRIVPINNREMALDRDEKSKKRLLKEDLYNNLLMLMEKRIIQLLDDDEIFVSLKSVQYEYVVSPQSITKLKIFGSWTHHAESLIRAAWCMNDKHLNIWACSKHYGL